MGKLGSIAWYHVQAVHTIDDNLFDLFKLAGNDCLAHRHVFKEFRRRSEELCPVLESKVRRDKDITRCEVLWRFVMRHQSRENKELLQVQINSPLLELRS